MNQKNVNGLLGFGVGAVLLTRDFAYDGHGGAVADLVPGVFVSIGLLHILMDIRDRSR